MMTSEAKIDVTHAKANDDEIVELLASDDENPNGYTLCVCRVTSKTRPGWSQVRVAMWIVRPSEPRGGRWTWVSAMGIAWLTILPELEAEATRQRAHTSERTKRRRA